jgi:hypothetical protein
MRQKMSLSSRKELLNRVVQRYQISTWKEKGRILDEFVSGSGYDRKHAMKLLNGRIRRRVGKKRMPPRRYAEAVRIALITVWKAANRICARRLMPCSCLILSPHWNALDISRSLRMCASGYWL